MAEFSAINWIKLSKTERVKVCRVYAAEAEKLAKAQPGNLGKRHMEIARQWRELANEIEGNSTPGVSLHEM